MVDPMAHPFRTLLIGVSFAAIPFAIANANTEKVLYSFQAAPNGAYPVALPIFDKSGAMYGTTSEGGTHLCSRQNNQSCGTVFKLARGTDGVWHETILFDFARGAGDHYISTSSAGSLVQDDSGALYSVISAGGTNGAGTAFKLTPPTKTILNWRETVLYNFRPTYYDATNPNSLITDGTGGFYGTSLWGAADGTYGSCESACGTIFHLSPPATPGTPWTETILHSFSTLKNDGEFPNGPLLRDSKGNLYGTTNDGGALPPGSVGYGVAFMLSPNGGNGWTYTIIHRFGGSGDAVTPWTGLVMDRAGTLYGATQAGSVFRLIPRADGTWNEYVIYWSPVDQFTGVLFPNQPTFFRGSLYITYGVGGSYTSCGDPYGCGLILKLTRTQNPQQWTANTADQFPGTPDGAYPFGGLVVGPGNLLYGVTEAGGTNTQGSYSQQGFGSVFSLTP
jgi:hypothetical protein